MRAILIAAAAWGLSGCAPAPPAEPAPGGPPLTWARLGETVSVDGPKVTPMELLEDSRCPIDARCVWAGQVRIRIKATHGRIFELTSNQPVHVADGSLELVEVRPAQRTPGKIAPKDYRFGFRFMGGL